MREEVSGYRWIPLTLPYPEPTGRRFEWQAAGIHRARVQASRIGSPAAPESVHRERERELVSEEGLTSAFAALETDVCGEHASHQLASAELEDLFSTLDLAIKRYTLTTLVWPMRCARRLPDLRPRVPPRVGVVTVSAPVRLSPRRPP